MDFKRKLDRLSGAGLGGAPRAPAPPQNTVVPPAENTVLGVASPAPAVPAPTPVTEAKDLAAAPPQALSPEEQEKQKRIDHLRKLVSGLSPKAAAMPAAASSAAGKALEPAARGELPVETRDTEHGRLHVADRLFPPHHQHGHARVAAALEAAPSHVASLALDPAFADVDLRGMLLVDTETTGLAGGSGTLPFLIGLGWFEGESLRLHQLFLKRPGEEGPMLAFLAERIRQASCLVTYNGKTFDWPLLRTRFVMNRLKVPQPPPHLDLLHCARRVFKYRAGGTRLVQVEEEVLGHRRIGDVDGSQIPELYFRFLRGGSASALGPVIEHNAHDLVLLAALLGKLAHGLKDGGDELDPRDRLGFAQVAARAELTDRALQLARSTAAAAKGALAAEAWQLSAWLLRQQGDARGAAEAFHRALPHADRKQAPTIHFALAKLYEHSLRNLPRALEHARRTTPAEGPADQARRVARLERRLSGHSGQAPLLVD